MTGSLCLSCFTQAQILKDIGNRIKQRTEQRANQKVDQTIDKGLDHVDNSAKDATKKKDTAVRRAPQNKPCSTLSCLRP